MKILFIHQGFPGQFASLITHCQKMGDQVFGVGIAEQSIIPSNNYIKYIPCAGTTQKAFPVIHEAETKSIRGYSVYKALLKAKSQGFKPDIVYAHPGWGEVLYIKQIWPYVPLVTFHEF